MTEIEKDLGFVILLTEFRFGGLRATTATINSNFNNARYICSIPADSNEGDVKIATPLKVFGFNIYRIQCELNSLIFYLTNIFQDLGITSAIRNICIQ